MKKKMILTLTLCVVILTSCDSYWPGMMGGYGMGGYGGVGMYGNPYATPIGVLPYHLRPDVYVENAYKQSMAKIQADQQQMAESTKRAKAQIEAQVAASVANGLPPVTVMESSPSTSTSYSTTTTGGSSTNHVSRDCPHCLGNGRCKTCNGTGLQSEGFGVGKIPCGVCNNHNGKCVWCSGTGKR